MTPGGLGLTVRQWVWRQLWWKDDNRPTVTEGKVSAVSTMQHSLQHVPLTLSQVSKVNWKSVQNFIKNDGFEYRVRCRYACFLSCANKYSPWLQVATTNISQSRFTTERLFKNNYKIDLSAIVYRTWTAPHCSSKRSQAMHNLMTVSRSSLRRT